MTSYDSATERNGLLASAGRAGDAGSRLWAKAVLADRIMRERHLVNGLVIPQITHVLEEEGHCSLHLAEATAHTARYLAALSFRAACIDENDAHSAIKEVARALERASQLTGVPGVIARGYAPRSNTYGARDYPDWHTSGGYVWLDGAGLDVYCAFAFGCAIACDVVPGQGALRDRMVGILAPCLDRLVNNGLLLTDSDNAAVSGGRCAPGQVGFRDRVRGLQVLQLFRIGARLKGDSRFAEQYRELAVTHDYAKKGLQVDSDLVSDAWGAADDLRAFEAYYHLLPYEDDPKLVAIYRRNLEANWSRIGNQDRVYLHIIHSYLTRKASQVPVQMDTLLNMPVVKQVPDTEGDRAMMSAQRKVPIQFRPPVVFEWGEPANRTWRSVRFLAPIDYLLAYWMGRYHRCFDVDGVGGE